MPSSTELLTVQRLSQYRPFERGGAVAREAQEDLVLATLAEGNAACSTNDCRANLETLFGIDLDTMEVARCMTALKEEGRVVPADGGFVLSERERERLERLAAESVAIQTAAMDEWRENLLSTWPALSEPELDRLAQDLDLYLRTVLRRHGAEAALLLYPDDERAVALFAALEEEGFNFLPEISSELEPIREIALSNLLRRPTANQQRFLARMLNTVYFLTILSIDPEGARLVREVSAGQRVYLDTNFIYRLLGIQGPRFMLPARTLVRLTLDAGYELAVTPWTVTEFQTSLSRSQTYLERHPVPPSEFAALAADAASEEDFVTAYWRKVRDQPGLKPSDFIALYSELEPHLSEHKIAVMSNGCTTVDQNTEAIDSEVGLLEQAVGDRYPRGLERLRHDARHRLLVLRLRADSNRSFATAGFWFLTHDTLLPRYDFIARGGRSPDPPFCVSAGAWFQVTEAFRPKSEDLDQSFADLLASPYVRYRQTMSKESAQTVAARLGLHRDASPELAARLFMNSVLMQDVEAAATPEQQTKLIDNAIVQTAKQAQEDAKAAVARAEEARKRAEQVELDAAREARLLEEQHERKLADEQERAARAVEAEQDRGASRTRELADRHQRELAEKEEELSTQSHELRSLRHWLKVGWIMAMMVAAFVAVALALELESAWAFLGGTALVIGVVAVIDQLVKGRSA